MRIEIYPSTDLRPWISECVYYLNKPEPHLFSHHLYFNMYF